MNPLLRLGVALVIAVLATGAVRATPPSNAGLERLDTTERRCGLTIRYYASRKHHIGQIWYYVAEEPIRVDVLKQRPDGWARLFYLRMQPGEWLQASMEELRKFWANVTWCDVLHDLEGSPRL